MDGRARAGPDGSADPPTVRAAPADVPGPADPAPAPGRDPVYGVGPADSGPADTGTLRRTRAPRSTGGEQVPPGAASAQASQPVRGPRPAPPTFPSPGQPPPGVARRDGRHARPDLRGDQQQHTPPAGYRPRHAAPDAETERFVAVGHGAAPVSAAAPPTAPPGSDADQVTDSAPLGRVDLPGPSGAAISGTEATTSEVGGRDDLSDRVRIVLAERRSPTRAVRTVAEIEAQTETGELLLGNLLRAQLTLAIRLGLVALLLLGALPVLFLVLPSLGSVAVLGVRIPWLLVGFVPYPFLVLLGWLYIRTAERNELDFADNVED